MLYLKHENNMNVYYKNNLRRKQNVIIYNDMF